MKKVLFAFVLAAGFAACGGGASTAPATTDSTKVADTTKMAADTTKKAADTTKMAADTTKKVADSTKK